MDIRFLCDYFATMWIGPIYMTNRTIRRFEQIDQFDHFLGGGYDDIRFLSDYFANMRSGPIYMTNRTIRRFEQINQFDHFLGGGV